MKSDYLAKYTGKSKKPKKPRSNVVVDKDSSLQVSLDDDEPVRVESKFKGFKRIDGEAKPAEPKEQAPPKAQPQQQTVYRDLTGRIVDINSVRAAKSAPTETVVKNTESAPTTSKVSFTVSKHDKEYNERLRSQKHFDDPMDVPTAPAGVSRYGRLYYDKGISPANRFGAKAGVMWDGVDRSNGFEQLVMKKRNKQMFDKVDQKFQETYEMDYE